jgi:hypothetical protein
MTSGVIQRGVVGLLAWLLPLWWKAAGEDARILAERRSCSASYVGQNEQVSPLQQKRLGIKENR